MRHCNLERQRAISQEARPTTRTLCGTWTWTWTCRRKRTHDRATRFFFREPSELAGSEGGISNQGGKRRYIIWVAPFGERRERVTTLVVVRSMHHGMHPIAIIAVVAWWCCDAYFSFAIVLHTSENSTYTLPKALECFALPACCTCMKLKMQCICACAMVMSHESGLFTFHSA